MGLHYFTHGHQDAGDQNTDPWLYTGDCGNPVTTGFIGLLYWLPYFKGTGFITKILQSPVIMGEGKEGRLVSHTIVLMTILWFIPLEVVSLLFANNYVHCGFLCSIVATADIQGISICQVEGNTYSIRCSYLSGSDADGCGYILVSGMGGVDNITGRIEMAEEEEVLMDLEISSFSELLGFDLDSTGDFFVTSAVTNIAACNRSSKSVCNTVLSRVNEGGRVSNRW